jgi:hypothetical protein
MLFSNVGKMNKMIGYDRYYDGGDCPDPCEDCDCESPDEAGDDCECVCHIDDSDWFDETAWEEARRG